MENKFCLLSEGRYSLSTQTTHVDRKSLYVIRHHENWRFQAIKNMEFEKEENLFFTAPLTISKSDFEYFKNQVLNLIEDLSKKVKVSNSEELVCLNIDLFKI